MRKVLFKRWIPIEYIQADGGRRQPVKDTGCFEPEFNGSGFFHAWGSEADDQGEAGIATVTIALVELPDGTIESVYPHVLKFVYPYSNEIITSMSDGLGNDIIVNIREEKI